MNKINEIKNEIKQFIIKSDNNNDNTGIMAMTLDTRGMEVLYSKTRSHI